MIFSNSFLVSAKSITNSCGNPVQVLETIKHTMHTSLQLENARSTVSLLFSLRNKNVGTGEVENCCRRMCSRIVGKNRALVKRVMTWKIRDAIRCRNMAQYSNTKVWREARVLLRCEGVLGRYQKLWREEKVACVKKLSVARRGKISFLVRKHGVQKDVPIVLRGVTVEDQQIPNTFSTDPRCYGGVVIGRREEELLRLSPKFAVYSEINPIECLGEVEKGLAKLRWSRRSIESEERPEYYDHGTKTFCFGNMRACDLPFNQRIHLPRPLPDCEEIELQVLRGRLKSITEEYVSSSSDPRLCNLNKPEREGLRSLVRKVKDQEVVVFQTDKSSRMSVDTPENYRIASVVHVEHDVAISEAEAGQIEKELSAHSEAWSRILCVGGNWNQLDRVRTNMISKDSPFAPVYTLRKDHKVHQDVSAGPPVRPVCGVDSSSNEKLSWLLSTIFTKLWEHDDGGSVCLSTEEMMAEIRRVNISTPTNPVVIGSADVKALYPSLDIDFTVDKVCQVFQDSDFSIDGVDYKELGLYLALNMTVQELEDCKLSSVCPSRKYPKAKSLKMTGCGSKVREKDRFASWLDPCQTPCTVETRLMMVQGLRIALSKVMHNHVYVFDGVIRRQVKGGPIGLQLTGHIAQVFMMWWDREIKARLSNLGLPPLMYKRYVDDINTVSLVPPPGLRYTNGIGQIDTSCIEEDLAMEDDDRLFRLWKTVGDSIHPSIQVEVDFPSIHVERSIPILDLRVWVEKKADSSSYLIMHEYYMKSVSSKAVINARSAVPFSMKRTVLTQEALRILLNCSRELPWERVVLFLNDFMARMQFSGYTAEFRYHVLNSAFAAYDRLLKSDQDGRRPLYRPREWNQCERVKEKRDKKVDWYKRGGFESVIFIPATPGSYLCKKYQKAVKASGLKIRIVERAGRSVKSLLQRSDPFRVSSCSRGDCFVCTSDGKGNCRAKGVTYEVCCVPCSKMPSPCRCKYIGETARNAYSRGKEHLSGLMNRSKSSVLWDHCKEVHNGSIVDFKMSVIKRYKNDAMMRQIMEAVTIESSNQVELLNTKQEWNFISFPRVGIVSLE